jgi:thiamine-phosphate pyrophosphorylase
MPTDFRLPRVYPLTDTRVSGLAHAEQLEKLARGGASLIQLRDKNLSAREFCDQIMAALVVARRHGVTALINDRVDLAIACGADGVHLGQDDLPPVAARKLMGDDAIIGYSTHNLEQATAAATHPINYLAVGPIFQTTSKSDTFPVVGLEGLRTIRAAVGDIPIVAIGGITRDTAGAVIRAGADSVAVIGALLSAPAAIESATQDLINCLSAFA